MAGQGAVPAQSPLMDERPHVTAARARALVVFFGLMETPHLAGEFYRKFLSRLLALETRLFERAFAERAASGGAAAVGGAAAAHVDPKIVARSFHGSLMFYNMAGVIVRVEPVPSDPKAMAEAIVNLYLPEVKQ